jgi:hypothetical protein
VSLDVAPVRSGLAIDTDTSSPPGARVAGPLLPEPGPAGLSGTQDALSMLYELVANQGQVAMAIGENAVTSAQRDEDAQLQGEKQAELAQQQAEANQGGFWHDLLSVAEDVAKVAGIVVAVAAVAAASVCTCGAAGIAAVVIAATLISAGAVVSATGCLGKYSDYIGMGMEVAGSILTMGVASGALASNAVTAAAHTVSTVAQVTAGAATVVAGVSTIEVGHFQGESESDAADVQQALNLMGQDSRLVNDIIVGLKSSQESNQSALKIIAGAAQVYDQTTILAASSGKA